MVFVVPMSPLPKSTKVEEVPKPQKLTKSPQVEQSDSPKLIRRSGKPRFPGLQPDEDLRFDAHPFHGTSLEDGSTLNGNEGKHVLINVTAKAYFHEHRHFRKNHRWFIETTIQACLSASGLDSNYPMLAFNKTTCRVYKTQLMASGITPRSVETRLSVLNAFLKWAQDNGYYDDEVRLPTAGLKPPKRLVRKESVVKIGFTDEQYKVILNHESFRGLRFEGRTKGLQQVTQEKYWALLALAYSGCRLTEIVQLLRSDIRQESGIYFFNIQEDEAQNKPIKNDFSNRRVPLHRHLIELGFLDYVKSVPSGLKLFPLLAQRSRAHLSNFFSSLIQRLGIKTKQLSLHSTRHSMTILLERARVHPSVRHRLMGHALGTGVEETVYLAGLTYSLADLQEALDKVSLPVDIYAHTNKQS